MRRCLLLKLVVTKLTALQFMSICNIVAGDKFLVMIPRFFLTKESFVPFSSNTPGASNTPEAGDAPDASLNPTKQKIIDAAKRCMSRWGIQKSSMNDIAREAGVSRNTLYCHFTNRDDVVSAAMLQAGNDFARRLVTHVAQFDNTRDRVIEGQMFCIDNLLNEPYLGLVNAPELAPIVNHALESREGLNLIYVAVDKMLEFEPSMKPDIAELAEVMARLLLSLLLVKGPIKRNREETREFFRRRLLPALGL